MASSPDRKPLSTLGVESLGVIGEIEIDSHKSELLNTKADSPEAAVSVVKDTADEEDRLGPIAAVDRFFNLALSELADLRSRAEVDAIERAADVILDCEARGGRVHVTGVGKSEHVARYIASLLSSTGTPAYFLHATECVHGSAGQVRVPDVTISVSNSGTTPELVRAVEVLRGLGIKIIGVSGKRD